MLQLIFRIFKIIYDGENVEPELKNLLVLNKTNGNEDRIGVNQIVQNLTKKQNKTLFKQ